MQGVRAAEVIQMQLMPIGINTVIHYTDAPALYGQLINNRSQTSITQTSMLNNAGSVYSSFYPGGSSNITEFNNSEVTALLDAAQRTADTEARRDIYYRIQRIIYDIQPSAILCWRVNNIIYRYNVGGMILSSDPHRIDLRNVFMVIDD
jgi:ABC-type transport system substrate-binding protein